MEMHVDRAEKHIQVNDYVIKEERKRRAFWRDLQREYPDYSIHFCYHNCEPPAAFLAEIGMILLESCTETRLDPTCFRPAQEVDAVLVSRQNPSSASFEAFAALHSKANPGMYWSAERVANDLSRWGIFLRNEAYVMMSLWGNEPEIFALEAANEREGAALLSLAAASAFANGKASVLYMVNGCASIEIASARAVGFAACGEYAAYSGTVR